METVENLPYSTILVPLSAFFAVPGNQHVPVTGAQRAQMIRWFWRACFSRRYSSGVLRNLKTDIREMGKLRDRQESGLGSFAAAVESEFFTENTFISSVVNTKTFVLMLAQRDPLSFVSGSPIDLGRVLREYNRNEFHHLYPRAFLRDHFETREINRLSNFAFISRADNQKLSGRPPSEYRADMDQANEAEILSRALCPQSLFDDDYERFTPERADKLVAFGRSLID